MTCPRLVLDTNVLVSALVFPAGSTSWLRAAWQSETVRPLASRETTTELIRVLAYPKFRLGKDERDDLLADYLPWCEIVVVRDMSAVPDCRDRHDRIFLALALAGRVDALVTGDGDLLALAPRFPIPIVSPATFRERLNDPASLLSGTAQSAHEDVGNK